MWQMGKGNVASKGREELLQMKEEDVAYVQGECCRWERGMLQIGEGRCCK